MDMCRPKPSVSLSYNYISADLSWECGANIWRIFDNQDPAAVDILIESLSCSNASASGSTDHALSKASEVFETNSPTHIHDNERCTDTRRDTGANWQIVTSTTVGGIPTISHRNRRIMLWLALLAALLIWFTVVLVWILLLVMSTGRG